MVLGTVRTEVAVALVDELDPTIETEIEKVYVLPVVAD